MLARTVAALFFVCSVATGQQPQCSSLTLKVVKAQRSATAQAWIIFVANNRRRPAVVRISDQNFHWKIEQAEKEAWNEMLTGGIGPGVPSTAATTPLQEVGSRTIRNRHPLLIGDFDLRRDVPTESLKPLTEYRISFEQDVDLIDSAHSAHECKLVTKPQAFRFEPK